MKKRTIRFLQLLILAGVLILNYFANAKMGMMRWLVYQNYTIEKSFYKNIFIICVAISVIFLFILILKKRSIALTFTACVTQFILLFASKFFADGYMYNGRYFSIILIFMLIILEFLINTVLSKA